jgi:hypothetical protein
MKKIKPDTHDHIASALHEGAHEGELPCVQAFKIAEDLGVDPLSMGRVADNIDVRFNRCQLGLYGYVPTKSIVEPADSVSEEMERLIADSLILGRLPCAAAWAIASRLSVSKLDVACAAEALGVRISQCQLGGF